MVEMLSVKIRVQFSLDIRLQSLISLRSLVFCTSTYFP